MRLERQAVRRIVRTLVIGWLGFMSLAAQAVTIPDLYEVTLPIQGNRDSAFPEALKVVAVRVSGRRDAAARLGDAANNARRYVQRFSFTADNQLQVAFDANSVDRLLDEAGLPIWSRERPATLVLLNAPFGEAGVIWLDAMVPAAEREAMARIAKERGAPIVWPTFTAQDRGVVAAADPAPAELLSLAARHNANAVLIGQGRRDAGGNLIVQWTLVSDNGAASGTGSVEEGVHLLADTFSRIYGTSVGTLSSVSVEVIGIRGLDDYAATMSYLEGMTLVRGVAVEQIAGESMRFQLAVRGDATALRRALALDHKLVPANTADEADTSRLRLRLQR
jgi:hypothetical protein